MSGSTDVISGTRLTMHLVSFSVLSFVSRNVSLGLAAKSCAEGASGPPL